MCYFTLRTVPRLTASRVSTLLILYVLHPAARWKYCASRAVNFVNEEQPATVPVPCDITLFLPTLPAWGSEWPAVELLQGGRQGLGSEGCWFRFSGLITYLL